MKSLDEYIKESLADSHYAVYRAVISVDASEDAFDDFKKAAEKAESETKKKLKPVLVKGRPEIHVFTGGHDEIRRIESALKKALGSKYKLNDTELERDDD